MDDLVQQSKVALATTFAFYLKAHNFHWNVEGPNFSQYHSLFGTIYEDAFDAVDAIAEHIRTLDVYAPGSLSRFSTLSAVDDQINIPDARAMAAELESDNRTVIAVLDKCYKLAEKYNKCGFSNFLQDRIDAHEKHGWMLRATGK